MLIFDRQLTKQSLRLKRVQLVRYHFLDGAESHGLGLVLPIGRLLLIRRLQVEQLVVAGLLAVLLEVAADVLDGLHFQLVHADVPIDDLVKHARHLQFVTIDLFFRFFFIVVLRDLVVKFVPLVRIVIKELLSRGPYPPVWLKAALDKLLHLVADVFPGDLVECEVRWSFRVGLRQVASYQQVESDTKRPDIGLV